MDWESWLEKNNAIETSHKKGEKKEEWNGKFSSSNTKDYVKDEKAQDEEEPLEELTDGKLEEVEKLKAWESWLEVKKRKDQGDVTVPAGTFPKKETYTNIHGEEYQNPVHVQGKGFKGRSMRRRDSETGKVVKVPKETTTPTIGNVPTSRKGTYQETKGTKHMSHGDHIAAAKRVAQANPNLRYMIPESKEEGLGSGTDKDVKTKEEYEEIWNRKQAEAHKKQQEGKKQTKMSQAQIDARRKRLLGKALWEKWLEKDALTGKQSRVGAPKATENIMSEAQEVIDRDERGKRNPMYKSWLEKMQGAGDARYGNQHLTGLDQKPVNDEDDANIKAEKDKKDNKPYKVLGKE